MKRLLAAIKGDVRLQVRYGFYHVYAIITAIYIIFLRQLPGPTLDRMVTLIIFIDPAILGFYFIGGLVLYEKGDRTLESLVVTPLRVWEYLVSKVISLNILSVLTSLIIVIFVHGSGFNYLSLITGVTLTSALFILIGFVAVARFQTINEYLMTSIPYELVLNLPLMEFFGLVSSPLFYLLPTKASLILLHSAFVPGVPRQILYAVLYLAFCIWLAYRWGCQSFRRHIISGQGGRSGA